MFRSVRFAGAFIRPATAVWQRRAPRLWRSSSSVPVDIFKRGAQHDDAGQWEDAFEVLSTAESDTSAESAAARARLAPFYLAGEGTDPNYEKALDLLKDAATERDARALLLVGMAAIRGQGVEKDLAKGLQLVREAFDRNVDEDAKSGIINRFLCDAYVELGHDQWTQGRFEAAREFYEKAVAVRDPSPEALLALGACLCELRGHERTARGLVLMETAINLMPEKDPAPTPEDGLSYAILDSALYRLAVAYSTGRGVETDVERAVAYALRGARMTSGDCIWVLLNLHIQGHADQITDKEARELLLDSAEKRGHPSALALLSECYRRGLLGFKQDDALAVDVRVRGQMAHDQLMLRVQQAAESRAAAAKKPGGTVIEGTARPAK